MSVTSLSPYRKLRGDLPPSADPCTGKTALHFPIPVLEKGCSSTHASASAGVILQRPFLTPVRPASATIKQIYNTPLAGNRAGAPDGPAMIF